MSNIKQTNIRLYVMSAPITLYQWKDFLGCAEPMLPMCQLKVKVTVKGSDNFSFQNNGIKKVHMLENNGFFGKTMGFGENNVFGFF